GVQLVLRDQRHAFAGDIQVGADRERAAGKRAFQKLRVRVGVARLEAQLLIRLPGAVELNALAARRREVRIADARGKRIQVDFVAYFGVEYGESCGVRTTAPFGSCFVRQRALRPQDLELRREKCVVLVDLIDVDETEA